MRAFCSNLDRPHRTGQYRVDAVLDPLVDSAIISEYECSVLSLLPESDPGKLVMFGSADGSYRVGYPEDDDMLPLWKEKARAELKRQRDYKMATAGAVTQVTGQDGNPIVMDARYTDKDNLEGLKILMDAYGMPQAEITDFYNNKHVVTRAQVDQLLVGMIYHVSLLIQEKWQKDNLVEAATSKMAIEDVLGPGVDLDQLP